MVGMEREITEVPEAQLGFVLALLEADGFDQIKQEETRPGVFTIRARKPAASGATVRSAAAAPTAAFVTAGPGGISGAAQLFVAEKESFVPFRYADVAGNATIGYGHHKGLSAAQIDDAFPAGLTEAEAWRLMEADLGEFADKVRRTVGAPLPQHRLDALVMVAFGRGNINAEAPLVKAGDHDGVAQSIRSIQTAGGKFNQGVADRYAKVAGLYLHGVYPAASTDRAKQQAKAVRLIEKLNPNRFGDHGNRLGLPTEEPQRVQAREAYFRMTDRPLAAA
jgi:GH24 family phage-related lysozyme (muramidase)